MQVAEAIHQNAHEQRQRGKLGRRGEIQRHGGASPLVNVRQPHMERYRTELEGNPDDQESETEPQRQIVETGIAAQRCRNLAEL